MAKNQAANEASIVKKPALAGFSLILCSRRFSLVLVHAVFAAALVFSVGCAKRNEPAPEDSAAEHAMELIDQGRADAAVSLLESHPDLNRSVRLRMTLASAHAALAGIRVEHYWDYTLGFENFVSEASTRNSPLQMFQVHPGATQKDLELIRELDRSLVDLMRIRARFAVVPYVRPESRTHIEKAMTVLHRAPSKGAKMYRAILGMILIKGTLQDATTQAERIGSRSMICDRHFPSTVDNLMRAFHLASEFLNDLHVAYPRQSPEILAYRGQIARAQENLFRHWREAEFEKSRGGICR